MLFSEFALLPLFQLRVKFRPLFEISCNEQVHFGLCMVERGNKFTFLRESERNARQRVRGGLKSFTHERVITRSRV